MKRYIMETQLRHLATLFERMADAVKGEDDANRRAFFATKNAHTGNSARRYFHEAAECRSQFVVAGIEARRLLNDVLGVW